MGRVGSCFDNAAAEAFFSTLEHEVLSRHPFTTKAEAREVVIGLVPRLLQHPTTPQHRRVAASGRVREDTAAIQRSSIKEPSTISGETHSVAGLLGSERLGFAHSAVLVACLVGACSDGPDDLGGDGGAGCGPPGVVRGRSSMSARRTTRRAGGVEGGCGRANRRWLGPARPQTGRRCQRGYVGGRRLKAGHLRDALCRAYDTLGFDTATGGDEVSSHTCAQALRDHRRHTDARRGPRRLRRPRPIPLNNLGQARAGTRRA